MNAHAAAKEAGGNHTGIVQNQKLIAAEKIGELREEAVLPRAELVIKQEQA
jgi:hypothetical protein